MRSVLTVSRLCLVTGALALAACGGRDKAADTSTAAGTLPPPTTTTPSATTGATTLATMELGKAVNDQSFVTTPTTQFGVRDTIYVSVVTQGAAPGANLTARWTFQDGQVVDSTTQQLDLGANDTTEFHISKATPWPAGNYRVEVLLNGSSLGTREFTVK